MSSDLSPHPTPSWPLNRERDFETWPHFNPGSHLDMNPSNVRLADGSSRVVFCRYTVPPVPGLSSIWVARVDDKMRPQGIPANIIGDGIDPRVVTIGPRVFVFYAVIERDEVEVINGSCVAMAEFLVDGERWTPVGAFRLPKAPIKGDLSAEANPNWEKNWVPFAIDENHIGLIYSHEPWHVLSLDISSPQNPHLTTAHSSRGIAWDHGTVRGGTPPVRYDDGHLVTFFHAAQVIGSRRVYTVGACVFQAVAPYAPVMQTTSPLLMAPYRRGVHRFGWNFAGSVVFPAGADRVETGYRLLCGLDDGEIGVFTIGTDELMHRLQPTAPITTGKVHDYRGREGASLPDKGLLYVPDPIPGIPELPMVNFVRTIAGKGRTFVDVGSHIGFYTMGLAPGFDRVIAFEPSRFQYKWLTRNRALNDYRHVSCEHVALGETPGEATLNVLSYEGGLNTLAPEVASTRAIIDQYTVPVEVLDARGLTDVDLLKIDVEGFEIPVLRGAVKTIQASRPVILVEVWTDAERRRAVQSVMEEMDYCFEPVFPLSPELVLCLPRERRGDYAWFV